MFIALRLSRQFRRYSILDRKINKQNTADRRYVTAKTYANDSSLKLQQQILTFDFIYFFIFFGVPVFVFVNFVQIIYDEYEYKTTHQVLELKNSKKKNMAASGGTDWSAVIKPILSTNYGNLNKPDILNIIKSILKR